MRDSKKNRVAILGVPIDNLSMEDAMQEIGDQIAEGGFHQVATANVDFLIKSIHDEELHENLCRCDLVLPDGMPLVWASRLMGTALKERVAGADLVPKLVEMAAARGYRIFLLGAEEESSARAAAWMERCYPDVRVVGRYCPEFRPLDQMDHEEILRRVEEARPDILLVAFGNPKQEKWLAMHRHRLTVPLCMGVGASLDFLSGKVSRAPEWMQAHGLEWLYRMGQEPGRLAKRYVGNALGVLCYFTLQIAATAAQAGSRSSGIVKKEVVGAATVFRIDGSCTRSLLSSLESDVCDAIFSGSHVVLDLSDTIYLGPDALGALMHLVNIARQWKREMWLTGLRPFLKRVVYATQLRDQFRMAPKVADALRRIEPDTAALTPSPDGNWAYCRIGGRMIPIHPYELQDLYRQMKILLQHKMSREQVLAQFSAAMPMLSPEMVSAGDRQDLLRASRGFKTSHLAQKIPVGH